MAQTQAEYPAQSYTAATVEGHPPPPAGYPGSECAASQQQPQAHGEITNRSGQGFWEGW
ncbi:hypothetical protein MKW92_019650 [Papaver armeniacum]|nr:hypothetical protein MKW92_019650 [Papaver armeniacum]